VLAYHHRNFGWVIAELVQRIDGRPFRQFLQDELTGPLGMNDFFVGLPPELEHRVSKEHAMEDCDRPSQVTTYNRPEVHIAVHPAGGGIATARDLAKFYVMMIGGGVIDGTRILKEETVAEVTALQVEGMDYSLERPGRRALGYALADPRMGDPASLTDSSFGHGGAGTSIGWADPETGVAMAYITNGFRAEHSNLTRLSAVSQAVRAACF
jgi:CubicO group peptidase (beta-lactamase class C family)